MKNPITGKNLELDFYLPEFNVGLEIQGPHHYYDEYQKIKDQIKLDLCKKNNTYLFALSVFQISPYILRNRFSTIPVLRKKIKRYSPSWKRIGKIKNSYKEKALKKYGKSDCQISPVVHKIRNARKYSIWLEQYKSGKNIATFTYKNFTLIGKIVDIQGRKFVIIPRNGNKKLSVREKQILNLSKDDLYDLKRNMIIKRQDGSVILGKDLI